MPSRKVLVESAIESYNTPTPEKTLSDYSSIISTPLGLALLEIQGELNLPVAKPDYLNEDEEKLFDKTSVPKILTDSETFKKSEQVDIVKFGKLEIDESFRKATLFISNTQRLIGSVEKLDPPLGVLKIIKNTDDENGEPCEIIDIIRQKIIFKNRPLPIM